MRTLRPVAVAWVAFALGVGASVAANVAHARPEAGPRLAAGFAPLALLLAVELATRFAWRTGWRWWLARWGGTGVVAAVAAVVSYRHMRSLLLSYGEDGLNAAIQPLAIDGLMVVAAAALLALGAAQQPATESGSAAVEVPPAPAALTPATDPPAEPATQLVADTSPKPAKRTPRKAPTKPTGTAARIAKLRAKQPDITQAAVVAKLRVSERTVQRHWNPTPNPPAQHDSNVTPIRTGATP